MLPSLLRESFSLSPEPNFHPLNQVSVSFHASQIRKIRQQRSFEAGDSVEGGETSRLTAGRSRRRLRRVGGRPILREYQSRGRWKALQKEREGDH